MTDKYKHVRNKIYLIKTIIIIVKKMHFFFAGLNNNCTAKNRNVISLETGNLK